MFCFLCDRPAKYVLRVILKLGTGKRFLRADQPTDSLDVCVDCVRRVEKVEYDPDTGNHIVHMRSLT